MGKIFEFWVNNKKRIITSSIFFILSILLFWGIYFFNSLNTKADSIEFDDSILSSNESKIDKSAVIETKEDSGIVKVDIKGEVKSPGVYEVGTDSRVADVIKKAGGLKNEADTSSINLSKKVYDEMVIIVYSKNEVTNIDNTKNSEAKTIVDCKNNKNKIENEACIDNVNDNSKTTTSSEDKSSSNQEKKKININTASLDELETITGIGEAKARSIIEYRSENSKFKSIEDILNVKGIGQALFEKIKNSITT